MVKLYEVGYESNWAHEGLVIKRGIKITDSLPIKTYNIKLITKQNKYNGRVLTAVDLEDKTHTLYFDSIANKNTNCDKILVHLPYYFFKTSGKVLAKSNFNVDVFVELKAGETLTIKIDTKEYYLMAITHCDIELRQVLIV